MKARGKVERVYRSLVHELEVADTPKDIHRVMQRAAGGSLLADQSITKAKAEAMLRRMFKENSVDQTVAELLLLNEQRWAARLHR